MVTAPWPPRGSSEPWPQHVPVISPAQCPFCYLAFPRGCWLLSPTPCTPAPKNKGRVRTAARGEPPAKSPHVLAAPFPAPWPHGGVRHRVGMLWGQDSHRAPAFPSAPSPAGASPPGLILPLRAAAEWRRSPGGFWGSFGTFCFSRHPKLVYFPWGFPFPFPSPAWEPPAPPARWAPRVFLFSTMGVGFLPQEGASPCILGVKNRRPSWTHSHTSSAASPCPSRAAKTPGARAPHCHPWKYPHGTLRGHRGARPHPATLSPSSFGHAQPQHLRPLPNLPNWARIGPRWWQWGRDPRDPLTPWAHGAAEPRSCLPPPLPAPATCRRTGSFRSYS